MAFASLTKRNAKMYFSDIGTFLSSLISPFVLLVLFAVFEWHMYKDSLVAHFPEGMLSDSLANAFVGGQLISALLATSTVNVAFVSNVVLVRDRVHGASDDFALTPCRKSVMSLSYFAASMISALIISLSVTLIGIIYLAGIVRVMGAADALLLILDVFLLSLFGVSLSSLVFSFLHSEGGVTTASMIVGAGYGFICGAYIPMAQLGEGVQNFLLFLPSTYGTVLLRRHCLDGALAQMSETASEDAIASIKANFDVSLDFFGHDVPEYAMYLVLIVTILVLLGAFVLVNAHQIRKARR
jgi:multidrug/hemolysin transport system permease protein